MHAFQKALAAAAGLAGATMLGSRYFYELAIPRRSKLTIHGRGQSPEQKAAQRKRMEGFERWMAEQPAEDLWTASLDGLRLHAKYIPADEPTDRVMILVHGYRSSPLNDFGEMLPFYRDRMGMNLLLPDDRGHGQSEGGYIGFGWQDHFDVETWIDVMVGRIGPSASVFLHGVSMGAATVMITAGDPLPKQVRGVIEDCGYTSLVEELTYCMHHYYHLPVQPFLAEIDLCTKRDAGYRFEDCDPAAALRKTSLPFLMIHGDDDHFVPSFMLDRNYDACASADKRKVLIHGADHALAYVTDRALYEQEVSAFIGARA